MKKLILSILVFIFAISLVGCTNQEAKSACKKAVAETYAKANDPTIT